jgi:membrane protease YdiL (CAAX protease family)
VDDLAPAPQHSAAPPAAGSPRPGAPPEGTEAWRPWTAPAALLGAIIVAALGGFVVDIPALAFGVRITSAHIPPGIVNLDTFVQDVGFVVTAVFFAQLGGRSVRAEQFGLRPTRFWRAFWLVVLTIVAFLVFAGVWSLIVNTPKEELLKQLGAEKNAALLIASALLTCVVAPVSEEFLFRGYIFTALRNWHGTVPAAILTGVLFGGVHATSAPALDLVPLAFLGFALCLLYRTTRSLYPCIVVHMLNNCYAFAELEEWSAWQVPLLMAASLAVLALGALALTRAGVLGSEPGPVGGHG